MIRVDVDASSAIENGADAARAFRSFPSKMIAVLGTAAADARAEHAYRNRTGDLEASTLAVVVGENNEQTVVDLTMGEDYASFVVARGFSNFPDVAKEAEAAVDSRVGNLMVIAGR